MKVPLLIEAVSRFKSALWRTLEEVYEIIRATENPYWHVLPPTWSRR